MEPARSPAENAGSLGVLKNLLWHPQVYCLGCSFFVLGFRFVFLGFRVLGVGFIGFMKIGASKSDPGLGGYITHM